jgi:transcriptional regulator with XRE-family HTH domain
MTQAEIDTLYRIISERVRNARKRRGLNQQDLATRIGKDRTSVVNLESGKQKMPLHVLWSIAEHVGVTFHELIPTQDEIVAAAAVPTLDSKMIAKIEEIAQGDPTVSLRLRRFLEDDDSANNEVE